MRFYTSGIRDVVLLIFIQMGQTLSKNATLLVKLEMIHIRNNHLLDNHAVLIEKIFETWTSLAVFKPLHERGLVERSKQGKVGKKSKQRFTIPSFVNDVGEKIDE